MRSLAALEPDLVVDTGDNLAHLEAVPALLTRWRRCCAGPARSCSGSNDYFAPRPKNPARYLAGRARLRCPPARRLPVGDLVDGGCARPGGPT